MDPSTMALVGAGVGAMMDKEQPLRGAALGGVGGYAGGAAMAGQAGTAGAYGSAMGATAPAGSIGGVAAGTGAGSQYAQLAAQGMTGNMLGTAAPAALGANSQAAMLAAQTGDFGVPGLLATGDAMATPGTMAGHGFNMGNKLAFGGGGDSANMIKAGQAVSSIGQQPEQRPPVIIGQAPQINPNAGGQINSPYQREEMMNFAYGRPSLLPSLRR